MTNNTMNTRSTLFSPRFKAVFSRVCGVLVGLVLLTAAMSKVTDLAAFHKVVHDIHLLPAWMTGFVVLFLPGLELTVGVCLLISYFKREATLMGVVLMFFFLVFAVTARLMGQTSGCKCFRIEFMDAGYLAAWWPSLRNAGFFVLSLIAFSN